MKKNFLVTTGLVDTWEFNENNFLLGKWCEFYEFDVSNKEKHVNQLLKGVSIIRNENLSDSNEKIIQDHEYLKKTLKNLLEIISEKLSIVHDVDEDKEYWRFIISIWLDEYTSVIFDRWENIRIFFERNKTSKFYTNFITLNDEDYISKDCKDSFEKYRKDEWNHLLFLRIFYFLNIQNLSLVEKRIDNNKFKNKLSSPREALQYYKNSSNLFTQFLQAIDKIILKYAFKYNKIIIESFYFPKKEFLKICLRCKLIPCRYKTFLDFSVNEDDSLKENKRIKLKNLLLKVDVKDKFSKFLLSNLHKDIPKSYLEDFDIIKKKVLPFAKKKKIIFSMHSVFTNDNFKIYIAETKKVGSKFIFSGHGKSLLKLDGRFSFFEKACNKIIRWDNPEQIKRDNIEQNKDIYVSLSPSLPNIKLKYSKTDDNCTILMYEQPKYAWQIEQFPSLQQSFDFYKEIMHFVDKLNPAIRSKVKFRIKGNNYGLNYEKKLSEMFGEKKIDKYSDNNPFSKTLLNSKLIISTYPQTVFAEAMNANVPTILIIKKNHWLFSKTALDTLEVLRQNHIAFYNFDEARNHINKYWKDLSVWWDTENVQSARKIYLSNFFNVKANWYKEWSDFIYSSKQL